MSNYRLHRLLFFFGWFLILTSDMFVYAFALFHQHEKVLQSSFCLVASVWWTHRMMLHCYRMKEIGGTNDKR